MRYQKELTVECEKKMLKPTENTEKLNFEIRSRPGKEITTSIKVTNVNLFNTFERSPEKKKC